MDARQKRRKSQSANEEHFENCKQEQQKPPKTKQQTLRTLLQTNTNATLIELRTTNASTWDSYACSKGRHRWARLDPALQQPCERHQNATNKHTLNAKRHKRRHTRNTLMTRLLLLVVNYVKLHLTVFKLEITFTLLHLLTLLQLYRKLIKCSIYRTLVLFTFLISIFILLRSKGLIQCNSSLPNSFVTLVTNMFLIQIKHLQLQFSDFEAC